MESQYRNQLREGADAGNKIAERLLIHLLLAAGELDEIRMLLRRTEARTGAGDRWFLEAELTCFHAWPGDTSWQELLRKCCEAGQPEANFVSAVYHDWARSSGNLRGGPESDKDLWSEGWCSWAAPTWSTVIDEQGVAVERSSEFAPRKLVAAVRSMLGPQLRPSAVVNPETGEAMAHPVRINRNAQWLPELLGWVGKLFECRLASCCDYNVSCGEVLNLLHYQQGHRYNAHLDCISREQAESPEGLAQGGQRSMTILVAMGDDGFTGGETWFPRLEAGARAATGELLRFNNTDAGGQPLASSLHEGRPLQSGEKWLLSKWVRQQPTPYGKEVGIICPGS
jgi:hypothetical protein